MDVACEHNRFFHHWLKYAGYVFCYGCLGGCYAEYLPEEINQLGIARFDAVQIQPIKTVTLQPMGRVKIPLKIMRKGNYGTIFVSVINLPSGVTSVGGSQIHEGTSNTEFELVGSELLGDRATEHIITVVLSMNGESVEQQFTLSLPQMPRPSFVSPPPVFLQPGHSVDIDISIERNGFLDAIALKHEELPKGVNVDFPQEPVLGTTVPVNITLRDDVNEGEVVVGVTATIYGRTIQSSLRVFVLQQPFHFDQELSVVSIPVGDTKGIHLAMHRNALDCRESVDHSQNTAEVDEQMSVSYRGPIRISSLKQLSTVIVESAYVEEDTDLCQLLVQIPPDTVPGVYMVPLQATADHISSKSLMAVRVLEPDEEEGVLSQEISKTLDPSLKSGKGGLSGRLEQTKQVLASHYGVTSEAEQSIRMSLLWLAQSQLSNGSWDPQASTWDRVGSTSAAILPFLAEGVTHEHESVHTEWLRRYPDTVKKGLIWLGSVKTENLDRPQGWLSEDTDSQRLAALVASEVAGLIGGRKLKQNAFHVAKNLADRHLSKGVWKNSGSLALISTVEAYLTFQTAKACEVYVSPKAFSKAEEYVMRSGRGGSHAPLSRFGLTRNGPINPSATAACLLACQYAGIPASSPDMLVGAEYLAGFAPHFDDEQYGQSVDFLLFASQVLRNLEGDQFDRWNINVLSFLTRTQQKEGQYAGTWDPALFGGVQDRFRTTILATLCLQTAYRYMPLYRE